MRKLLCIVGTRPQILKHSVFVTQALNEGFSVRTIHTGQHWDYRLYGAFLKELDIPKPEYSLGIRDEGFGKRLGRAVDGIIKVIKDWKPDGVVVYGDCDSTLAGALAARRCGTLLVHLEAGLRSADPGMPEEVNRIVVDELADYLFAPTPNAGMNLAVEGVRGKVFVHGDIVKDLIVMMKGKIPVYPSTLPEHYYCTIHREENTTDRNRLKEIFDALCKVSGRVCVSLHPRTRKKLKEWGLYERYSKNLEIWSPLGYVENLGHIRAAKKVITDSGTIQKEAYILGTPCVTLRDTTEYPDTQPGHWNLLCPDVEALPDALALKPNRALWHGLFGDGYAVIKILAELKTAE